MEPAGTDPGAFSLPPEWMPSPAARRRTDAIRAPEASDATSENLAFPGFDGEQDDVRPFLRWAGGKSRLLSAILPHVPQRFNRYYEPFLGGGAMYFATRGRSHGTAFLTDLNSELINAWRAARDEPAALLLALKTYAGRDTEKEYYDVRSAAPTEPIERAARFVYLNQTAWNALWRVNRWGVFNVPWGARPFRGIETSELLAVSRVLKTTVIEERDFREALETPTAGDFVYLDPPYLPVSDTSKFSGYTERRFRQADLGELSRACEDLTKRGVNWILSNRDTPLVRELFSHARIVSLTIKRSVAAQNRRDVQPINSPEAIVVGGPDA